MKAWGAPATGTGYEPTHHGTPPGQIPEQLRVDRPKDWPPRRATPAPPPAPPATPTGPAPCTVCGVLVSAEFIARTGAARHGHHPQDTPR